MTVGIDGDVLHHHAVGVVYRPRVRYRGVRGEVAPVKVCGDVSKATAACERYDTIRGIERHAGNVVVARSAGYPA